MLHSLYAPAHLSYLNTSWVYSVDLPTINGMAHYVTLDGPSMHILFSDGVWLLCDGGWRRVYAVAFSDGLHPNTVYCGEWFAVDERCFERLHDFCVCADMRNSSPERPLLLDDIGYDVFERRVMTMPAWFLDPVTLRSVWSGAKSRGGAPGKRFCLSCNISVSANNFVTQHLTSLAHCRAVQGAAADHAGGEPYCTLPSHVSW